LIYYISFIYRIDIGIVVEKVEEILKDHPDLILGFNKFLPKGYEILLPPKDYSPAGRCYQICAED